MSFRVVAYISDHGYGHGSQTTAVLNALALKHPGFSLTIVSGLPAHFLRSRLRLPFTQRETRFDFGLSMTSVFEADRNATLARYHAMHDTWDATVAAEAEFLRDLRPNLVLSNVAYLPLASAQIAGIPNIAMSSLNWADIFEHYFSDPSQAHLLATMRRCYANSDAFIQLTPAMPMEWLPRRTTVPPVASLGEPQSAKIRRALQLPQSTKLILISFGGIESRLAIEHWPRRDDIFWLLPRGWEPTRADMAASESLDMPFIDVLSSADAVVTKIGYGMVSESACNGVPVVYCERNDWPEERFLQAWLIANNRAVHIERNVLISPKLLSAIDAVLALRAGSRPSPTGADAAAEILSALASPTH